MLYHDNVNHHVEQLVGPEYLCIYIHVLYATNIKAYVQQDTST